MMEGTVLCPLSLAAPASRALMMEYLLSHWMRAQWGGLHNPC
jgi:hypothetical protein